MWFLRDKGGGTQKHTCSSTMYRKFFDSKSSSDTRHQLLVPESLRKKVIEEVHEGVLGGHLGEEKTFEKLKISYYWPGYRNAVKEWCRCHRKNCRPEIVSLRQFFLRKYCRSQLTLRPYFLRKFCRQEKVSLTQSPRSAYQKCVICNEGAAQILTRCRNETC